MAEGGVSSDMAPVFSEVLDPARAAAAAPLPQTPLERFALAMLNKRSIISAYREAYGERDLSDAAIRKRAGEVLAGEEYQSLIASFTEHSAKRMSAIAHGFMDIVEQGIVNPANATLRAAREGVEKMSDDEVRRALVGFLAEGKMPPYFSIKNLELAANVMGKMWDISGNNKKTTTIMIGIKNYEGEQKTTNKAQLPTNESEWRFDRHENRPLHLPSLSRGREQAMLEMGGKKGFVRCPHAQKLGDNPNECWARFHFAGSFGMAEEA